jgi:hypothetical protein
MQKATLVTRWIVRLAGLSQIILGLLFWTGRALSLIPAHMIIGLLVAIGLCFIAVFASRAGTRPALVVLAIAWALVLPVFGVTHAGILPGSLHWIIRVLHLAVGIGALGLADRLADEVLRRGTAGTRRAAAGASA